MAIIIIMVVGMFIAILVAVFISVFKPDLIFKMKGMDFDEDGNVLEKKNTKSELQHVNPMDNQQIGDTKSFIPIEDKDGIINGILNLGYHNYRAIIECSSLNYFLMSEQGTDLVELSFQRFLNSLTFPISIYTQTREFDTGEMLAKLHKNIEESEKRFPGASAYMREYEASMEALTEYMNNEKIKKKYIIVHFNGGELNGLSALNGQEIREYALNELENRCQIVINGMAGMGITAKVLDTAGTMECIYAYVHRTVSSIAREIADGTLDALAINSENPVIYGKTEIMTAILNEAQMRIDTQIREGKTTYNEDMVCSYITGVLEFFKERLESDEGIQELVAYGEASKKRCS